MCTWLGVRYIKFCLTVILACLAPIGASQEGKATNGKHNPQLDNLAPNTWVCLAPKRTPAGRSYSGICYGNGLIYYFGGGHGSYSGNDVELYDVAANTWTQATEPEHWTECGQWSHLSDAEKKTAKGIGGGWGVAQLSPKGRPLTQHSYQQHVWFPDEQAFYNYLQAAGLWAFDPAKKEWTQVFKGSPNGADIHGWNLGYDPELKTVFAIISAGPMKGVHVFDREKKALVKKWTVPVNGYYVHSTYDARRKVHVVLAAKKWWTLNLASGETKFIADAQCAKTSVSLEYDPESGHTLVWDCGKLQAYDPATDAWTEVALAGAAPKGDSEYDKLTYDPVHRCFLFLAVRGVTGYQGGATEGPYAFRYKPK